MDPNATLERLRELRTEIIAAVENEHKADCADEMAELFDAIDAWLKSGGFLPFAWTKSTWKAKAGMK